MESKDIAGLLDRFDASACSVLELREGEWSLRLEKPVSGSCSAPATSVPAPAAPDAVAEAQYIKAPLVGTFYSAPAPGEAPFAVPGGRVRKGDTVCVLEAMKMMSEIPAPMDCVIEEVLLKDGELAGFDTPLFRVREG